MASLDKPTKPEGPIKRFFIIVYALGAIGLMSVVNAIFGKKDEDTGEDLV